MKCCWLNNQNNENLIVFFAGWSFDENPFKFLECKNYDLLFVYDYNDFEIPEELKNLEKYKHKSLITWSMGVFAAYKIKDMFNDFEEKIAINGTVTPVDNSFGIPVKMFELTLKHSAIGLKGKFYQNVFNSHDEYERYSQTPVQRTIENRVSELENLYDLIKKDNGLNYEKFYDKAIVSEFDKIIPPKNQLASHEKNNTPVITLATGHFPFYNFSSWSDILKCKQI